MDLVLPLAFYDLLPNCFTYITKRAESTKPCVLLILQIVQTNIPFARNSELTHKGFLLHQIQRNCTFSVQLWEPLSSRDYNFHYVKHLVLMLQFIFEENSSYTVVWEKIHSYNLLKSESS